MSGTEENGKFNMKFCHRRSLAMVGSVGGAGWLENFVIASMIHLWMFSEIFVASKPTMKAFCTKQRLIKKLSLMRCEHQAM